MIPSIRDAICRRGAESPIGLVRHDVSRGCPQVAHELGMTSPPGRASTSRCAGVLWSRRHAGIAQRLVEDAPGGPDEGMALAILGIAGLLAHEHQGFFIL